MACHELSRKWVVIESKFEHPSFFDKLVTVGIDFLLSLNDFDSIGKCIKCIIESSIAHENTSLLEETKLVDIVFVSLHLITILLLATYVVFIKQRLRILSAGSSVMNFGL